MKKSDIVRIPAALPIAIPPLTCAGLMAYEWMIHFGDESILKDILQSMVRLLERKEEPDSFVEWNFLGGLVRGWSGGALGIWWNGSTFAAK